jgi:hypothetical protein
MESSRICTKHRHTYTIAHFFYILYQKHHKITMKNRISPCPHGHLWRIVPGTGVKTADIVLMTVDHVPQMFAAQGAPGCLGWFGRPAAAMFLLRASLLCPP